MKPYKKKWRYVEISPSRNVFDPIYLMFKHVENGRIKHRKALRWDLQKKRKGRK